MKNAKLITLKNQEPSHRPDTIQKIKYTDFFLPPKESTQMKT